jgi:hypothetical protein
VPSTTTTPSVMSASSVTQFVTTFYSDYSACFRTNDVSTCATGLVRENGTPNLESHYTPAAGYAYQADPITCAQNYLPAVHVSGVTTTPTRASGTVTEDFAPPITTGFVVVDQSGMLKIDAVTCTPPLEAVAEPTAPTIPATTMSALAGTWGAHETDLVITNTGAGHMTYADLTKCPSCSEASAPRGTVAFVLTTVASSGAAGYVTESSDPANWAVGAPVKASLTPAIPGPGQFLALVINGTPLTYFCNSTSVGQCGA